MTARTRTILLIAVTLFLLAILSLLVILDLPFGPERQAERLVDTLHQVDDAISKGYFDQASTNLDRATAAANSSVEWLRILKRAHLISKTAGSYDIFTRIALRAVEAFPHRQDLAACAVYGMMRSRSAHDPTILGAVETLGKEYDSLTAEAYLHRGAGQEIIKDMDGYFGDFVQTVQERNPDDLTRIAGFENEPRLFLDAALLLMKAGEIEKAYSLISRHEVERRFPEAAMAIDYDYGDFTAATKIYRSAYWKREDISPGIQLFGSDIFLSAGLIETADENYREFLKKHPDHSWIPYYNLSILHPEASKQFEYVREGLERFPGNELLSVRFAILTWRNGGGKEEAMRILEDLRDKGTFGQYAALEVLRLTRREISMKRFEAELWRLFNSDGVIEDTVRYLLWYLAGIGDTDSMKLVLERSEPTYMSSWWLHFYSGVLYYSRGEREAAIKEFQSARSKEAPWQTEYNLGVLHLVSGDYVNAAHFMREALSAAGKGGSGGIQPEVESTILTGLSMVLLESGDREGALREVRYALELDPSNLSASLILKKAEQQ